MWPRKPGCPRHLCARWDELPPTQPASPKFGTRNKQQIKPRKTLVRTPRRGKIRYT